MAGEEAVGMAIIGLIMLVFVALGIAAFVFWILMLVDCATRKLDSSQRIAWILILVLTGILGAAIYYFVVKRKR
jgi:hypothetical protein